MSSVVKAVVVLGAVVVALAGSQFVLRAQGTDGVPALRPAMPGTRFSFEVIESFDAKYEGDTPGHIGRGGIRRVPQPAQAWTTSRSSAQAAQKPAASGSSVSGSSQPAAVIDPGTRPSPAQEQGRGGHPLAARHDAAGCVGDLAGGGAPHLSDGLGDEVEAVDVGLGHAGARSIDGEATAIGGDPAVLADALAQGQRLGDHFIREAGHVFLVGLEPRGLEQRVEQRARGGMALAVASTVVLVRVLADNNDLHTQAGHIAVGWLVVEDLFTVVALVLLPEDMRAVADRLAAFYRDRPPVALDPVAYVARLVIHRYAMLGVLDEQGFPLREMGILQTPAVRAPRDPAFASAPGASAAAASSSACSPKPAASSPAVQCSSA